MNIFGVLKPVFLRSGRLAIASCSLLSFVGCSLQSKDQFATPISNLTLNSPSTAPAPTSTPSLTADHLVLVAGNSQTATVASTIAVQPKVQVVDISGTPIAGVSVSFNVIAGGGAVTPTSSVTDSSGQAFTNWTLGSSIGANTMIASATLPGSPSTITFSATATAGAATQLRFATQPSATATAGAALSTPPVVEIADTFGNLVSTGSHSVTLSVFTDAACTIAGSGTFGAASNPLSSSSGSSIFSAVNYSKAETIYLRASAPGLSSACSTAIVVSPAAASVLAFFVQPSSSASTNTALATQPVIEVRDAFSNRVTAGSHSISLSVFTDSSCSTSGAGTLSASSNPLTSSVGLSSFSGVQYTQSGTLYLRASASGLTSACSNSIVVSAGAASKLAFSTQPSSVGTAGATLATQPIIRVEDATNNLVSTGSHSITLSAFTDSSCTISATGTLSATSNPLASSGGIAAFTGVSYTKAETVYLRASAGGLTSACSTAIAIDPATANSLAFLTQPSSSAVAGSVFAAQPIVKIQDTYGNTVTTASNAITISAYTDSGCTTAGSGTLGASVNPVSAIGGQSAFAGVNYTKAEILYLRASAAGLSSACSNAITVSAAAANYLTFSTQPSATANAGSDFSIQPIVSIYDSYGNSVTSGSHSISLSPFTDSGCTVSATGTLSATSNPLASSGGIATFAGVSYSKAETVYLQASASGLSTTCSSAIAVSPGSAATLSFFQQPSFSAVAGSSFGTQPTVEALDAQGNRATGASLSITLSAFTDAACTVAAAGTFGASTNPVSLVSGLSSYTGVNYTKAETIYLKAAGSGVTPACSSAVAVGPSSANRLSFATQPASSGVAGTSLSTSPVVRVEDTYGNLVSTGSYSVTLGAFTDSSCSSAATGTFTATSNPVVSASGNASFSNVTYTKSETIYLRATASGLMQACSTSVAISPAAAISLNYFIAPSSLNRPTVAFSVQPVVQLLDSFGNRATTSSANVTLSAFTDSGCSSAATGSLTMTTNPVASSAGLANFASVTYSRSEKIYIRASAAGLTSACSGITTIGVDLEVPIELLDYGVSSLTTTQTWDRTRTSVTPSLYDGSPTYRLEVVCENSDTLARNVGIVSSAGSVEASLAIPSSTTVPTRFETSFTPTTPTNYRVQTEGTTSSAQLKCYAARILIRQVYATKTQIYVPLIGAGYATADNITAVTGGVVDSTTSGTASQNLPNHYIRWRKDSSVISGLAAGTPWTFEAVLSRAGGASARAALYTSTGTAVTGGELTQTATTPTLTSLSLADNAVGFNDATDFEVRIRRVGGGTTAYIYKAGLYATLSNIIKTQVYYRVGRYAFSSANLDYSHQRTAVNTNYFYSPTVHFEITGNETTVGTSNVSLKSDSSAESGTSGSAVSGSSLNPNSTTIARLRSSPITLIDGDRCFPSLSVSSGTMNINNSMILISTP